MVAAMPSFTCATCATSFDLSQKTLDKYPGWTPKQCRTCRSPRGGGRPAAAREENLTTGEVLAKYSGGPTDGVFTDGAADPNPGPGGWGAVYVRGDQVVEEVSGSEAHTTNNRMELTALIAGYRLLPDGTATTVWTDSNYAVRSITEWAAGWERNGWKRKTGPVENLDLVQELYALARARPEVELRWLRGHAGSRWNEYADALATSYRRASR